MVRRAAARHAVARDIDHLTDLLKRREHAAGGEAPEEMAVWNA
jgi:hypothetical protein